MLYNLQHSVVDLALQAIVGNEMEEKKNNNESQ